MDCNDTSGSRAYSKSKAGFWTFGIVSRQAYATSAAMMTVADGLAAANFDDALAAMAHGFDGEGFDVVVAATCVCNVNEVGVADETPKNAKINMPQSLVGAMTVTRV